MSKKPVKKPASISAEQWAAVQELGFASVAALARQKGISPSTLLGRLGRGISVKNAISATTRGPRVASPKSTGGGGFDFETKIGSWFVVHMLSGATPAQLSVGPVDRVDFQTAADGWYLDDLLVYTKCEDRVCRFAISVKSNQQFSKSNVPPDFVQDVWKQFLRQGSDVFDASRDHLGLVTSSLNTSLVDDLDFIVRVARESRADLLPERFSTPRWTNGERRTLFRSLACPAPLAKAHGQSEASRGELIGRLRFLQFDFEGLGSTHEAQAIRECGRLLWLDDAVVAKSLWREIQTIVREKRKCAGTLERPEVVAKLRNNFRLAGHPRHCHDVALLAAHSTRASSRVRLSIGASNKKIDRPAVLDALRESVAGNRVTVAVGPTGCGKSALARELVETQLNDEGACLWIDVGEVPGRDLLSLQSVLGLSNPLPEVLLGVPDAQPVLVLDGLDRTYDSAAFSLVADLLNAIWASEAWRVLITCDEREWARIAQELQARCVDSTDWRHEPIDYPSREVVAEFLRTEPGLGRIPLLAHSITLLRNLKVLDLVSRIPADRQVPTNAWVGETSIATWLWREHIGAGPNGRALRGLTSKLARRQADSLASTTAIHELTAQELLLLGELSARHICSETDDRIRFDHVLYADWACYRYLASLGTNEVAAALRNKASLPTWHRAIRLYALGLLESGSEAAWRSLVSQAARADRVLADLALEAPAYSPNAGQLLTTILPILRSDENLARLLQRFLMYASTPDPHALALFGETVAPSKVAAWHRRPVVALWRDVLVFLHQNRSDLVSRAPTEIGVMARSWMRHTSIGFPLRDKVADLAVDLARLAHAQRGSHRTADARVGWWETGLLAAVERPDEIAELALLGSTRGRFVPAPPRVPAFEVPLSVAHHPEFDSDAPEPTPWPLGPRARVDDSFRSAVLERWALAPLIRVRPAVVVEVVLACLLRAPSSSWNRHPADALALELVDPHRWRPPFWTDGPFLQLLREDFTNGISLIGGLVDFASERWVSHQSTRARLEVDSEISAMLAGSSEDEHHVTVILATGIAKTFVGGRSVLGWSSALNHPPNGVVAALMSLEKFLYEVIEREESVDDFITEVLTSTSSTAFLGVLLHVATHHPGYLPLLGPLKNVVTSATILSWDVQRVLHEQSGRLSFGPSNKSEAEHERMQKFVGMPHRRELLRDHATHLFLADETAIEMFDEARVRWQSAIQAGVPDYEREHLEHLIAIFDRANWEISEESDGSRHAHNATLERRNEDLAEDFTFQESLQLMLWLPTRCSTQLREEPSPMSAASAALLLGHLELLRNQLVLESEGAPLTPERERLFWDAIMGGVAVLLVQAREFLDSQQTQWCLDRVRNVLGSPPSSERFSSERGSNWGWECFTAYAVAGLWVADCGNPAFRELAAQTVILGHRASLEAFFRVVASARRTLGEDFNRIRSVACRSSHVRFICAQARPGDAVRPGPSREDVAELQDDLLEWIEQEVRQFVARDLPPLRPGWSGVGPPDKFADWQGRLEPRSGHWAYPFDLDFVIAAETWSAQAVTDGDAELFLQDFWLEFGELLLNRAESRGPIGEDRIPWQAESTVLKVCGRIAAVHNTRRSWVFLERVLSLPRGHCHWVRDVIDAFHRQGLAQDSPSGLYQHRFEESVSLMLSNDGAAFRRVFTGDVRSALVALDAFTVDYWGERHADLVVSLAPVFEEWIRFLPSGRRVSDLVRFLQRPEAALIRTESLSWLAAIVTDLRDVDGTDEDIANLLGLMWDESALELQSDSEAFESFRMLLHWAVARQVQLALALVARVGMVSAGQ